LRMYTHAHAYADTSKTHILQGCSAQLLQGSRWNYPRQLTAGAPTAVTTRTTHPPDAPHRVDLINKDDGRRSRAGLWAGKSSQACGPAGGA
jgi:hypothetical protein